MSNITTLGKGVNVSSARTPAQSNLSPESLPLSRYNENL